MKNILLIWAILFIGGCSDIQKNQSFTDVPSEKTPLINNFISYSGVEEVIPDLKKKYECHAIEDSRKENSVMRPPFHIYTFSISKYQHLGFSGELVIGFFNNRLMETVFYPDNYKEYIEILRNEVPNLRQNIKANLLPYTVITLGIDYKQHQYISWVDSRLQEQMNVWIKLYS